MAKKIVATFKDGLDKIEFYQIMYDYKEYTLLRRQGTNRFCLWNNKTKLLSREVTLQAEQVDKGIIKDMLEIKEWYFGMVFFWADSKFVTEYGMPNYEVLIDIYRKLVGIRVAEVEMKQFTSTVWEEEGFIPYVKCRWLMYRYVNGHKKTIKELAKEFKVIW